jgi:hypothetical protein
MSGVPYIFATATTSIPLSQLDANFATVATLGNASVGLGNTTSVVGNLTLQNVTITSGTSNITTNVASVTGILPQANGGTGTTTGYYGFKNRIINGAMQISQRNGTSTVTPSTNGTYTVDRWQVGFSSYAASKFNIAQNLNSVTLPVGFSNYVGIQVASTATPGSTDNAYFAQPIEANNMGDLAWGTANAKTVTLSFQVYVSVTGTYSGSIFGYSSGRSYPFSFTVSSANTWTPISITIAGDTSGTWAISNSGFAYVLFNLGSGSSNLGTAGSWSATQYYGATGSIQLISNASATFYITGVQLEVGSTATSFDYRPYGTELALCQRYYEKTLNQGTTSSTGQTGGALIAIAATTSSMAAQWTFKVTKRASPTLTLSSFNGTAGSWANGSNTDFAVTQPWNIGDNGFARLDSTSMTAGAYYWGFAVASAEL